MTFATYEKSGRVATITLNRPESRNAIATQQDCDDLAGALWKANDDENVNAVILTGAILWLDAVVALPLIFSFVWLIQTRFIRDEEARLTLAFGPEFDLWAARTRRWFGRKSGV